MAVDEVEFTGPSNSVIQMMLRKAGVVQTTKGNVVFRQAAKVCGDCKTLMASISSKCLVCSIPEETKDSHAL